MCGKGSLVENVEKKEQKTPETDKIDILESLVGRKFLHFVLQR